MIFKDLDLDIKVIESTYKLILVENFHRKKSGHLFPPDYNMGGWGNGYVCLPNWHPWYKKDYNEINILTNVHGGLTFTQHDEEEDLWVIGFDTNHYDDDLINCSFDFVLEETKKLEQQCLTKLILNID